MSGSGDCKLSIWFPLQIADLPVEEYEALWSEYVSAYAEHLLKADNDPSSPAGMRLVRAAGSSSADSCLTTTMPAVEYCPTASCLLQP